MLGVGGDVGYGGCETRIKGIWGSCRGVKGVVFFFFFFFFFLGGGGSG